MEMSKIIRIEIDIRVVFMYCLLDQQGYRMPHRLFAGFPIVICIQRAGHAPPFGASPWTRRLDRIYYVNLKVFIKSDRRYSASGSFAIHLFSFSAHQMNVCQIVINVLFFAKDILSHFLDGGS